MQVSTTKMAALGAIVATMMSCTIPGSANAAQDWGLNGTFTATSNGEWSKQNEVFRDEITIRSTWTISMTCSASIVCSGTVDSDLGWTAPIFTRTGKSWYVEHIVPRWMPCPDGTFADGRQVFKFYSADLNPDPTSGTMIGEDITTGPSGACGKNRSLEIRMPFKLVQIS